MEWDNTFSGRNDMSNYINRRWQYVLLASLFLSMEYIIVFLPEAVAQLVEHSTSWYKCKGLILAAAMRKSQRKKSM